MFRTISAAALCCVAFTAFAQDNNPFSGARSISVNLERQAVTGIASWYGYESGTETASGKPFNPEKMTCAMRRRDWGTTLIVTVIETGISATCELTDFGPAKWTGRVIDVSEAMAKKLGFHKRGVIRVKVE